MDETAAGAAPWPVCRRTKAAGVPIQPALFLRNRPRPLRARWSRRSAFGSDATHRCRNSNRIKMTRFATVGDGPPGRDELGHSGSRNCAKRRPPRMVQANQPPAPQQGQQQAPPPVPRSPTPNLPGRKRRWRRHYEIFKAIRKNYRANADGRTGPGRNPGDGRALARTVPMAAGGVADVAVSGR